MNDLGTTALGPPAPAAGFPSHSGRQAGQVRKFTRAPSLELVHHFVRIVVGADDKMNVIAHNDLGDTSAIHASPAAAGNELFIRSQTHLYCLRSK